MAASDVVLPADLSALTLKDVTAAISALADPGADEARAFYDGDHWQEGKGWIGPTPSPDHPDYATIVAQIQAGFISENVVAEVADRHVTGVLGNEPLWRLTPKRRVTDELPVTDQERAAIDGYEAALTEWWDERKPLLAMQDAARMALLTGRGVLRVFIPAGLRDEQGRVGAAPPPTAPGQPPKTALGAGAPDPLALALRNIYVDAPDPAAAGVFTEPDTRHDLGAFAYKKPGDQTQYAEVSFVGADGQTTVRVYAGDASQESALPLGGRILIYEIRRKALITPQVRQAQRALNNALTNMTRNVNLAGSRERLILNAQPPGRWIEKETGADWQDGVSTGTRVFEPGTLPVGPGATTFLQGAPLYNAQNEFIGYANPNVSFHEPVSVATFTDTRAQHYASILGQSQQAHALIAGDATASGESRKQARAEYEGSLTLTASAVNDAGRWLIETTLALAAVIAGQPGAPEQFRADFTALVDSGPLSSDETGEVRNNFEAGLLSRETAMSRLGVEDVDAEAEKIDREEAERDQRVLDLGLPRPGQPPPTPPQPGQPPQNPPTPPTPPTPPQQ